MRTGKGSSGLPPNGVAGDVIVKQSAAQDDAIWEAQSGSYTQVVAYANLPAAADYPGEIYIVQTSTGFLWNRRAGFYRSNGTAWNRMSNATFQVLDDEMTISDNADSTKKMDFELSEITSSNTRTLTMADEDIDLGDMQETIVVSATAPSSPTLNQIWIDIS